jgi:glycosyltransferase involved in cell wall biosynthesis
MDGIQVYRFNNISNFLAHKNLSIAPSMVYALRDNIQQFDLVHLHEFRSIHSVAAYKFALKYHIPYVLNAYGSLPRVLGKTVLKAAFDSAWGSRMARDAGAFIAQSKEEVEDAMEMGVEPSIINLVYNGMDTTRYKNMPPFGSFRRRHSIDDDQRVLLFLGRIHKSKGIDFALDAFAKLSREFSDVVFAVCGADDGFLKQCRELASRLGVRDRVRFTGLLGDEEKLAAYHDSDLFVHVVEYMGGVGLVPLEAILCGTPVIVSAGCGEVVKDAECGYVVEYRDVEGLKETIEHAFTNPDEGREMVRKGREYIERNLSWNVTIGRIERVYSRCIAQASND